MSFQIQRFHFKVEIPACDKDILKLNLWNIWYVPETNNRPEITGKPTHCSCQGSRGTGLQLWKCPLEEVVITADLGPQTGMCN